MRLFKSLLILLICCLIGYSLYSIMEHFNCYAPEFNTSLWNHDDIRKYNNCYSYAMNYPKLNRNRKASPGFGEQNNGAPGTKNAQRDYNIYTCDYFDKLIKNDWPNIIKRDDSNASEINCPEGYYEMALVIDDNGSPYEHDGDDFHFYRKDCDRDTWSHKPGGTEVSVVDADGKLITDPKTANRDYGDNNYYKFCSYYCVPFNDKMYTDVITKLGK